MRDVALAEEASSGFAVVRSKSRRKPAVPAIASSGIVRRPGAARRAIRACRLSHLPQEAVAPGARLVEGYQPSTPEIGWLLAQLEQRPAKLIEPPPRPMVWLACWDCRTRNAVSRASSELCAVYSAICPR